MTADVSTNSPSGLETFSLSGFTTVKGVAKGRISCQHFMLKETSSISKPIQNQDQ